MTSSCGGRVVLLNDWANVSLAASRAPAAEITVVVVNCGDYGGAGYSGCAVTSRHPLMGRVAAHELGHSFAGLADEYGGAGRYTGGEPSQPNVTIVSDPAACKWSAFAGKEDVATFEGGGYFDTGIWRPTANSCMMRTLQDNYCLVCRDVLNRRIQQFGSGSGQIEPVPGPGSGVVGGAPSSSDGGGGGGCAASASLPPRSAPIALLVATLVLTLVLAPRSPSRRAA